MEKTIKIGKQSILLNNNIGWTMVYRDQFGTDIVPTLMPALRSLIDIFVGMMETTGQTENLTMEDLGKIAASDAMVEALSELAGLEFVDFINITWSLAKCADDSIEEPKVWVRQFDEFPIDVIGPELFKIITHGMISTKNLKGLQTRLNSLKPSHLTTSSSPDLIED